MYGKDERLRDTYTRKEKQKKMVKSLMNNMVKKQERLDQISNKKAQKRLVPKYKGL